MNPVLIVIIAVSAVVGAIVGSAAVKAISGRGDTVTIESALMKAADEINRNLPMMVDANTRLDATTALPDNKFMYSYTVVGVDELPAVDVFTQQVRPGLVNLYRTSTDMSQMRNAKTTLIYAYHRKDGTEYAKIEVLANASN